MRSGRVSVPDPMTLIQRPDADYSSDFVSVVYFPYYSACLIGCYGP
jgi:hypothetical protein